MGTRIDSGQINSGQIDSGQIDSGGVNTTSSTTIDADSLSTEELKALVKQLQNENMQLRQYALPQGQPQGQQLLAPPPAPPLHTQAAMALVRALRRCFDPSVLLRPLSARFLRLALQAEG